jgi:SAM-dependent methyltransferase
VKECSKSIARRLGDSNFTRRYFVGDGLDIGGRPDPLGLYQELFCLMRSVRTWDRGDGDAQFLHGVPDEHYDFVHSSHCLEHLNDPIMGIRTWIRVLKPGGHLIVTVPDEDLYEQGVFPSTFNSDHKWTFTIFKARSWCAQSVNVIDMIKQCGDAVELIRLEQLNSTYRFDLPRYDQTLSPVAESGIEFIIRKRTAAEVLDRGRWRRTSVQPASELRKHLNQYRNDMANTKNSNAKRDPFTNDADI